MFERNLMVYRRSWLIIFSGLFEPLFYLASIGFGLGHFVGRVNGVSYASYIAPALLASSAMNGAIYDATTNVFWKLRYAKVYDAVLATPLGPTDVALGETSWAQFRGLLYAAGCSTPRTSSRSARSGSGSHAGAWPACSSPSGCAG
jgi:lipooligosaccharide transport system permease protein